MTDVYVTGAFYDASFILFNQDNTPSSIVLQNSSVDLSGSDYNAFLAKYNSQGIAQWGVPMGGTVNPDDIGNGVTVDGLGNVYVIGEFIDQSFNLYNSGNTESGIVLQNSSGGGANKIAFLAKYDSTGIAQWGVPMGGTVNPNDIGNGVTVDGLGNVYVTGQFQDQSFNLYSYQNSIPPIVLQNSTDLSGNRNAFLAKYDSQGIAQWGVPMGGEVGGEVGGGSGVTVDFNGNVYVTGGFSDQSFNLYNRDNVLSGIVLANSNGVGSANNAFIAKYDSQGIAQWGVPMGGTVNPEDSGNGVTVDLNGNVYVAGQFKDQSFNLYSYQNSIPPIVLQKSTGGGNVVNAFLAKYNSQGRAQWGVPMGGLSNIANGYGVSVDLNGTAVYVTGRFQDQSFNLYSYQNSQAPIVLQNSVGDNLTFNVFLAKYSSDGIAQWGVPMGGVTQTIYDSGWGVIVDMNDVIYITGQFQDQSFNLYSYQNSQAPIVLANSRGGGGGYGNAFLAQYNSDGIAQWGRQMGELINPNSVSYGVAVQRFFYSPSPPFNPVIPLTNQSAKQLLYNSFSPFLRQ